MACPAAVVLVLAGNSSALGALLFGSAYLTMDDLSTTANNLSSTIASASLSAQAQQQAYQEALRQALQLPSSDAVATLAAAAFANNQTASIADSFVQVSLTSSLSSVSSCQFINNIIRQKHCSLPPSCLAPVLIDLLHDLH